MAHTVPTSMLFHELKGRALGRASYLAVEGREVKIRGFSLLQRIVEVRERGSTGSGFGSQQWMSGLLFFFLYHPNAFVGAGTPDYTPSHPFFGLVERLFFLLPPFALFFPFC